MVSSYTGLDFVTKEKYWMVCWWLRFGGCRLSITWWLPVRLDD